MVWLPKKIIVFLISIVFWPQVYAVYPWYIDGTTSPKYFDTIVTFTDNATAKGYVYFRGGFSVAAGKTLELDIIPPVGGKVYLNTTGKLFLLNDVHLALDSNTSFYGGYIDSSAFFLTLNFDNEIILHDAIKFVGNYKYLNMNGNVLSFEKAQNTGSSWSNIQGIVNDSNVGVFIKNAIIIYPSDYHASGIGYDYYVPSLRVTNPTATPNSSFNITNCAFYLDTDTTCTTFSSLNLYGDDQFFPMGKNSSLFTIGGNTVLAAFNRAARLTFNENITLKLNNTGATINPELLSFFFNNGNLQTNTDFTFAKSFIGINGKVNFETTRPGKNIIWGDGSTSANDTNVLINPGSTLSVGNDLTLQYKNVGNDTLSFGDKNSAIEIMPTGTLQLYTNEKMSKITGTIQTSSPRNIIYGSGSGKLFFENGVLAGTLGDDLFEINLTGTYDTQSTYSLILDGVGNTFNMITPGSMSERLRTRGTGSTIMGYPVFKNANAILLSTNLIVAADGEINTNIDINGGTLTLGADLVLKDDVQITNSGTIDFQGYNLFTGQKDLLWTDTQLLIGAQNLSLGGDSSLRGQWHFKNNAHIVGNNFMLDLTNGGSLFIKANTTLLMSNLILKGLGTGFIIFEDSTSQLELFNVVVDMDKNVTMTHGNVYVSGDSTVITRDKFLTFDATSSLTVDRSTFFYDTLSYNDQNNVKFTSLASNFASLNGGSVRKVRSLPVGDYIVTSNIILDRSLIVSPLKKLRIEDNATINGDGFAYQFALNPGQNIFFLSPGKQVTFQNILMQDVPISYFSVGSGSQLIFGDSTTVDVGASGHLTTTWYFDGRTVLNGNNNILDFGPDGHIVLKPGAQLWINNITLRSIKGRDSWGSIVCTDNNCTLSFGNITWVQDADYSMTQGNFYVVGYWDMQGTSTFNYATNKQSLITSFGTLEIDKDFTFNYMPSTNNRDLIAMESSDAILNLNGGTLSSTTTGIRLTKGTLMIPELGNLYNYGAVAQSEAICFGNDIPADDLTVRVEGNLQLLSGRLMYENAD